MTSLWPIGCAPSAVRICWGRSRRCTWGGLLWYALEVGGATPAEAEQRVEKLARAYEDGKSYLLSRWRWPDRFNP